MNENEGSGQPKILVADDDPAILQLVKTIVEKEGYEMTAARDGRDAQKLLQSDVQFAAAVFDGVMPYLTGAELVEFMHSEERLREIPVIVLTAEKSPRPVSESHSSGAVAFLAKPFTGAQLQTMLKMFVERRTGTAK